MLTPRSSRTDESGAAAVVCALLALVTFAFAALAVDLGNAVARRGDTQVQVDFGALAGGGQLNGGNSRTASDPAVARVADYMFRNLPADDAPGYVAPANAGEVADDLVDTDMTNGNVEFLENATRMKVTGPETQVNFGFAGIFEVFEGDATGTDVNIMSDATVAIRSPGAMLPFFLPRNCVTGPVALKNNTNGAPGNPNLTFDPASANGAVPDIDTVTPATVPFSSSGGTITLEGSKFNSGTLEADFFEETSNDRVPALTTASVPATYIPPAEAKEKQKATVVVPDAVANRPGYWQVRLKNNVGWSSKFGRIFVDVPSPEPGCGVAATGDFGFLDSPRTGVTQQAVAMSMNIAQGIDHTLKLFTAPLPGDVMDSCNGNGGTPFPGAVLDVAPPNDDANCVSVQTGFNSGDALTSGLVTGGTAPDGETYDGFLEGDTLDGCDRNGGSSEKIRIGVTTNDDVLTCFLPVGVKVGDITGKTIAPSAQRVISSRIFDSPRFAVVPIIGYPSNPQNGFYPIVGYRAIFITDETANSTPGSSFGSSLNGVVLNNSGNKVESLIVVPIHPDALPETAEANGGSTIPWLGSGTKIVTLID